MADRVGEIVQVSEDVFESGYARIVGDQSHCETNAPGCQWDFLCVEVWNVHGIWTEREGTWRFKKEELFG